LLRIDRKMGSGRAAARASRTCEPALFRSRGSHKSEAPPQAVGQAREVLHFGPAAASQIFVTAMSHAIGVGVTSK
jgi:hypothetical protein